MSRSILKLAISLLILVLSCTPQSIEQQGSCVKAEAVAANLEEGYFASLAVALGRDGKVAHRCQAFVLKQKEESSFDIILPRVCLELAKQHRLALEFPTQAGAFNRVLIKSETLERMYSLQRLFPGGYPMPLIRALQTLQDSHKLDEFNSAVIQEERGLLGHPICSKGGLKGLKKHSGYLADCYSHFELIGFKGGLLLGNDDLELLKSVFRKIDTRSDTLPGWVSSLVTSGELLTESFQLAFSQFYQGFCIEQQNEKMCNTVRRLELEKVLSSEDFFAGNRSLLSLDSIPSLKKLRTEFNQHFLDQSQSWEKLIAEEGFSGDRLRSFTPDVETGVIKESPLATDREVEPIELVFREYGILNLKGTPFGTADRKDALWTISGIPVFVHQDFSPANFVVKLLKEPLTYFENQVAAVKPKETESVSNSGQKNEPESYRKVDPLDYNTYKPNTSTGSPTGVSESTPIPLPEKKNPCL